MAPSAQWFNELIRYICMYVIETGWRGWGNVQIILVADLVLTLKKSFLIEKYVWNMPINFHFRFEILYLLAPAQTKQMQPILESCESTV